jgi:hypothetical protein
MGSIAERLVLGAPAAAELPVIREIQLTTVVGGQSDVSADDAAGSASTRRFGSYNDAGCSTT